MSLFSTKTEDKKTNPAPKADSLEKSKKETSAKETQNKKVVNKSTTKKTTQRGSITSGKKTAPSQIILSPMVTEKAHAMVQHGKYAFHVSNHATKLSVKNAVKSVFDVDVVDTKIINVPAKTKTFRGRRGSRKGFKKAIVTVKKGQHISIFEGA